MVLGGAADVRNFLTLPQDDKCTAHAWTSPGALFSILSVLQYHLDAIFLLRALAFTFILSLHTCGFPGFIFAGTFFLLLSSIFSPVHVVPCVGMFLVRGCPCGALRCLSR